MIVTLLVSTGAPWEADALRAMNEHPGVVVLKRCVDVDDLLATASAGQAQVAVLAAELPGFDATVVEDLRRHAVRVVAVTADPEATRVRAAQVGIDTLVAADRASEVAEAITRAPGRPAVGAPAPAGGAAPAPPAPPDPASARRGRVIAVWGTGGAPGRTTLAAGLAAELARRRLTTVLLDADPYGGAVAQQLGILDEVSGLLSAARLVAGGQLDGRLTTAQRRLTEHLRVVTGLPRPDRWTEVRPGTLAKVIDRARAGAEVVVDTGFSVEPDLMGDPGSARPERNGLTREAVDAADDVLVVGGADPVGLARLARAVGDLRELTEAPVPRLVVNRMRPTLGWREADVVAMLADFGPNAGVHFLPDDQAAVDKAVVAGRTLLEAGDSPLTRAIAALVDAIAGRQALNSR